MLYIVQTGPYLLEFMDLHIDYWPLEIYQLFTFFVLETGLPKIPCIYHFLDKFLVSYEKRAIDMSENSNMKTGPDYNNSSDSTAPEWLDGVSLPTTSADVPPAGPLPLGEAIRQLPHQYIRVLT